MRRIYVWSAPMLLIGCIGGRSDLPIDATADGTGDVATDVASDVDAIACPTGSITFTFAPRSGAYCIGAPGACSVDWLTIVGPSFEATLDRPCVPDCADCEPVGCPASCPMPQWLTSAGTSRTWDGTWFLGGTCGADVRCTQRACAPAGRYTARMCAYESLSATWGACSLVSTPTCDEVAFDWPPPGGVGTVSGFVGEAPDSGVDATDAGACCPNGWLLYGCSYPDGAAGFNCHNPALGCASSLTCGEGCDFVVSGRC